MGLHLFDLKIIRPIKAAKKEASKTLIFEAIMTSESLKAKFVMKMLIVKPIPPNNDIPKMCRQFKPGERLAIPALTATNEVRNIPANFPMIRPQIIPIEFDVTMLLTISFGNTMAVFTRANTGRIINATG